MRQPSSNSFLAKLNFGRALGPLEARIMEVLWRRGASTVRDVLNVLVTEGGAEIAYTTVMTVMRNLADKGLLESTQAGRAHVYTPSMTHGEFVRNQVRAVLNTLLDSFTEPTLSYFVERLSAGDAAQLAELERLIAAERRPPAAEEDPS